MSMEQIPLFSDENLLRNSADEALAALRLEDALKGYREYAGLYGTNTSIGPKVKLAEYLFIGLSRIQCADENYLDDICELWDSFIHFAQEIGFRKDGLLSDIRKSFFHQAATFLTLHHAHHVAHIGNTFPAGFIYMQIGCYEKAVETLRARIANAPENARFWGYLGDAHFLRGNGDAAGRCFFQSFLLDPSALDWQHLQCGKLLALRDELRKDHEGDQSDLMLWIAFHAYLRGIIKPVSIVGKNEITKLVECYLEREAAYIKNRQADDAARIFLMGIVLCAHEPLLRQVKSADFAAIRARMKEIHPALFEQYIQNIAQREKRYSGNR